MNMSGRLSPLPRDPEAAPVILTLSPYSEDSDFLSRLFSALDRPTFSAVSLADGMRVLSNHPVAVVITDVALEDATWSDVLDAVTHLETPPLLIVTSRHADEALWAEVLNVGGYDLLMKPFDVDEVSRTVSMAALRWNLEAARMAPGRSTDSLKQRVAAS
jgi:DNA-binding NtrC family response regulator